MKGLNRSSGTSMTRTTLVAGVCVSALLTAAGCRVETHNQGDGKNDNVKIATPFGGMEVKTNDAVTLSDIGLPVYPGATPLSDKESGKDHDSPADINMSFGAFKMRIKAMSYRTSDDPGKVLAFYRGPLGKYGDVIECHQNHAVGTPTQTSQGLTCDNEKSNHITVSGSASGNDELKAGSQQHQHIVGTEKKDGWTKIGLVALDLPGHLSTGDDEKQ